MVLQNIDKIIVLPPLTDIKVKPVLAKLPSLGSKSITVLLVKFTNLDVYKFDNIVIIVFEGVLFSQIGIVKLFDLDTLLISD